MRWFHREIDHNCSSVDTAASAPREPRLWAVNVSQDVVIATDVEWAGTSEARRRGLLGRDSLPSNAGIYIVPTQWIHMFGMRFPIDVAFLDAQGRILSTYEGLRPNRLSRIVWRAEGALELCAGVLRATRTGEGDIIKFVRPPGADSDTL